MAKGWGDVKSRVHNLYIDQRRPLHEVVRLMRETYGFDASPRAYKTKFKEWGYEKNRAGLHGGSRSDIQTSRPEVNSTSLNGTPSTIAMTSDLTNMVTSTLPNVNLFDPISSWPFHESPDYLQNVMTGQETLNAAAMGSSTHASSFDHPALQSSQHHDDLNGPDHDGLARLHHSVVKGSIQEIEDLLSLGAMINVRDSNGDQPLHYAASRGMESIVRLLLKRGADMNSKGRTGMTPLHMSLRFPKVFRELLKAGPVVSAQDDNGDTPLHLRLSSSTADTPPRGTLLEKLMLSGGDVNIPNNLGITPFHRVLSKSWLAGEHGDSYLAMFLEHGAVITSRTADGRIPFDVFLENSNFRWAEYQPKVWKWSYGKRNLDFKHFIAKGADPNTRLTSGETLLNEVINRKCFYYGRDNELAQILCESADINNAGLNGNSPLHCLLNTSQYDTIDFVKKFLRLGANPNQPNDAGESPLMVYLKSSGDNLENHLSIVRALLQGNADPMQRNLAGELPIYLVIRKFNAPNAMPKLLLEETSPDGMTRHESEPHNDQPWWELYYSLRQASSWSTPAGLVESSHLLPRDVSEVMCRTALDVLAEKFLSSTKESFISLKETQGIIGHTTRSSRDEFVSILRDCKALEVSVDIHWYHFLLEMYD